MDWVGRQALLEIEEGADLELTEAPGWRTPATEGVREEALQDRWLLNAPMGWSTADISDQSGKVFVVTGANSGLGLETTRALVARGATVVAACRNPDRASDLASVQGTGTVDVRTLDLADLASVGEFAGSVRADFPVVDVLINNAGVMAIPFSRTVDGFETQIGVNHLGHFALTGQLLEPLLRAGGSRVVSVSSGAHRMGTMEFENLHSDESYSRWRAYGRSKLANLLFTYELQRHIEQAGAAMSAVAAHPGYAATNLQFAHARQTGRRVEEYMMHAMNRVLGQSAADGALPQLYAATAPNVVGGDYIGPSGLFESRGAPKVVMPHPRARDEATAARLWTESVELTGVDYAALDGR